MTKMGRGKFRKRRGGNRDAPKQDRGAEGGRAESHGQQVSLFDEIR